jgi:hypothetical protein
MNAGRSYVESDVSLSVALVASHSWVLKTYVGILAGRAQA